MTGVMKFSFGGHKIRVFGTPDDPWFVAMDVCRVLGIKNSRDACKSLPRHHKVRKMDDRGADVGEADTCLPSLRSQNYLCVTSSGLYKLALKSLKPDAEKFQLWITDEVLPSIQNNGFYDIKQRTNETPMLTDLVSSVREAVREELAGELAEVKAELSLVRVSISSIKGAERKKLTPKTIRMHKETIHKHYNLRCPCCADQIVIDEKGDFIGQMDHWVKVSIATAQATWPVCEDCNQSFNTQYIKSEKRIFFDVYQDRFRLTHSDKQVNMFDSSKGLSS